MAESWSPATAAREVVAAIPFPVEDCGHDDAWWSAVEETVARVVARHLGHLDAENVWLRRRLERLTGAMKEALNEPGR